MDRMYGKWRNNTEWEKKSLGVAFLGGTPYLTTETNNLNKNPYHRRNLVAYLALLRALGRVFGPAIPNTEFLISTGDEPWILAADYGPDNPPPPVLRYCKSDSFADVLVPDMHFFTKNYSRTMLGSIRAVNRDWPWARRSAELFGRFTPYDRTVHAQAPELYKRGANGTELCVAHPHCPEPPCHAGGSAGAGPHKHAHAHPDPHAADPHAPAHASSVWLSCRVREHFLDEWAPGAEAAGAALDAKSHHFHAMSHHARFKWLLNLDGVACSSRLEQLLALGGMVVKEESGYRSFYYPLLRPNEHYVPFWLKGPEEVLAVMDWAAAHDVEAAAIAAAGQRFVGHYLRPHALMCYWFTLLKEMGPLMRFTPGPQAAARAYPHWRPVEGFMAAEGEAILRDAQFGMEFWD
ncbi:hypothetical protein HYH03_006116 [Edaphochlamys debaryana]|uniref:Glycosyl transferase CAP10 domain-containing protein n=1 Tax=Edaphochlamys debaryana TaxID=47281 RepID=A0A835Y6Y4_9CHLO|nr:hypothetical protein HYH03_006116 [Edaphochlamys debaryana]|eukprot:KAG2495878.1 hypothetical protein HYH03_006116 [Edaphochlamys debaryana]